MTVVLDFNPHEDRIDAYKCPPLPDNTDLSEATVEELRSRGCELRDTEAATRSLPKPPFYADIFREDRGYYKRTFRNKDCPMHLVTDTWNNRNLPCGDGSPISDCYFKVTNIRLAFEQGFDPASTGLPWSSSCQILR